MHLLTALVFAVALWLSTYTIVHLYDYFRPRAEHFPANESPHFLLTGLAALAWGLFYYLTR